ncbi:MAG: hypothetical protein WC536_01905 [Patescibacteria group bacterium]
MENEHGLSPKDMGIDNEEETQIVTGQEDLSSLNNGIHIENEATPVNEAVEHTASQNEHTAQRPVMGGEIPKSSPRPTIGNESVMKDFADIAEGIEKESGLDNLSK